MASFAKILSYAKFLLKDIDTNFVNSKLDEVCSHALNSNFSKIVEKLVINHVFKECCYQAGLYDDFDSSDNLSTECTQDDDIRKQEKIILVSHFKGSSCIEFMFLLYYTSQTELINEVLKPLVSYLDVYKKACKFISKNPTYKRDISPREQMELDELQRRIRTAKYFHSQLSIKLGLLNECNECNECNDCDDCDVIPHISRKEITFSDYITNLLQDTFLDILQLVETIKVNKQEILKLQDIVKLFTKPTVTGYKSVVSIIDLNKYIGVINLVDIKNIKKEDHKKLWTSENLCYGIWVSFLSNTQFSIPNIPQEDIEKFSYIKEFFEKIYHELSMLISFVYAALLAGKNMDALFLDEIYFGIPLLISSRKCDDISKLKDIFDKERWIFTKEMVRFYQQQYCCAKHEIELLL